MRVSSLHQRRNLARSGQNAQHGRLIAAERWRNRQMSAALQLQQGISDAEWHTRCELAALYHVIHHFNWTDGINTHMSARVPGEPNHFLINNYGETFAELTASSLVKMDMDGNVLSSGGKYK